jgi:hypothetical protein
VEIALGEQSLRIVTVLAVAKIAHPTIKPTSCSALRPPGYHETTISP